MPWKLARKGGKSYVKDKDGKLTPEGGYPDTDGGKRRALKYIKALYANSEGK